MSQLWEQRQAAADAAAERVASSARVVDKPRPAQHKPRPITKRRALVVAGRTLPLTSGEVSIVRAVLLFARERADMIAPTVAGNPSPRHVAAVAGALLNFAMFGTSPDDPPDIAAWRKRASDEQ